MRQQRSASAGPNVEAYGGHKDPHKDSHRDRDSHKERDSQRERDGQKERDGHKDRDTRRDSGHKDGFFQKFEQKVESLFHGGKGHNNSSRRAPGASPNISKSHGGGKHDHHAYDSDGGHRDDGRSKSGSGGDFGSDDRHKSSGGGGGGGKWNSKLINGMVMLSVEVNNGSEFPKRIAVKRDTIKVTAFDVATPGSTKVRIFTAPVSELVRELSHDFVDYNCFFRALPDTHEPLGTVKELRSGKDKASVQLTPSLELENVYSAAIILNKDGRLKGGKEKADDSRSEGISSPLKSKLPSDHKKPGPMSRLDDLDRHSDSGSVTSDASRGRQRRKPSSDDDRKSTTSHKSKGNHTDLEVVGTSFSKAGGSSRHDEPRTPSNMSKQHSFVSDDGDGFPRNHSPNKKGSSDGFGRQDSFKDDKHSRKSSPSRHGFDEDDNHSRKSSTSPRKSSGSGHGDRHQDDNRSESSQRRNNSDRNDSRHSSNSPTRKSSSKSYDEESFFKSYDNDDEDRGGFAGGKDSGSSKHRTRGMSSGPSYHGEDEVDEDDRQSEFGSEEEGDGHGTRSLGAKKPKSAFRTAQRFSANRPWAGAIVAPSNAQPIRGDLPKEELVLEYVHAPGVITFPAGSVGVVMDIKSNRQRFFQGRHKEDVTAITIHPSKRLVATGDIVSHNNGTFIYIWDPQSPEDTSRQVQIRVGEKKLARGIADLQFSPDGEYLVATGMDDDHTVYLYEWKKGGKLIGKEKGHTDANSSEFVTFGVKHLKHWTVDKSGQMKAERGIFGSRKVSSIICCTYLPNNTFVTGAHGGELIFWNRNQVINIVEQVHSGGIYSVYFDRDIGLITGGKDGAIIVHDPRSMDTIDKLQLPSGVRSIDVCDGDLLVGLEDSVLAEVRGLGDRRSEKKVRKILEGHSALKGEELWGCATDPNDNNIFITSGDDSTVFKRSIDSCKTLASRRLEGKLRAINFSPDSKYVAVGNDNGDIYILKSSDLSPVHFEKYQKPKGCNTKIHAIEVVRFSPNGRYLAVGGHDHLVYVYEMGNKFKRVVIFKGHSSFVTHLDWTSDSNFIQTTSGDYELLFCKS
ncbi:Echinoderm microtubule-associated protein-like 5 [Dinochytrium kinnereticum]|nr:Echinoderm microtubule-associated protein-like 5 [Dinochytrium kinnereticum]